MPNVRFEINKELLKRIINAHKKFIDGVDENILNAFHFEVIKNELNIYTTDGHRALKSTVEINNISNMDCSFNVSAYLINNLVILSNSQILLDVTVEDDSVSFTDGAAGTTQKYVLTQGIYPNVQKLIDTHNYKDDNFSISFDKKFFNELNALICDNKTNIINLNFNKEDNLKLVVAHNFCKEIKQTALLMPAKI